jgi:hypothetical protein
MKESEIEKRIMAVFKREKPDKVPWMPRIEHWYNVNKVLGNLPDEFKGLNLVEVYRKLNAAMRLYVSIDSVYGFRAPPYGSDMMPTPLRTISGLSPWASRIVEETNVQIKKWKIGSEIVTEYKTPVGKLKGVERLTEHGFSRYFIEHPVKSVEDFKVLEYILERTEYKFDMKAYEELDKWLNGQGMIWVNAPRSPLQRLLIEYMGIERTFVNLYRNREKVEGMMELIGQVDNKCYKVIKSSPIKVVNLADNLDCRIVSPNLFKRYYIPYYQERCSELHKAGKFTITHADGNVKALLPLFKETGLDGVEAVTFKPVGDVTIEEVKREFGDELILVDGIPYWHFLPEVSMNEFDEITRKVIEAFSDRLILGVSDEISPRGDFRKLYRVLEIIEEKRFP